MLILQTVGAIRLLPNARRIVSVSLGYDPANPLAVVMAFEETRDNVTMWVEWMFARMLLADGLYGPAGDGDVRIELDHTGCGVWVRIASDTGFAWFQFSRADLADFIADTDTLVPLGKESVDLDALEWEARG